MQRSSPLRISITVTAVAVSIVTAAAVHANSIHEVIQVGFTFDPRKIVVEPGDTVRWIWSSGLHTVTSGAECTFDGVHFDEPLTSVNPVVEWVVPDGLDGDVPYFCRPHCVAFDMVGTITVVPSDACPADLDGSGAVDFGDILAILTAWGNKGGPEDLDQSGAVDFGDLLVVLGSWGPCE